LSVNGGVGNLRVSGRKVEDKNCEHGDSWQVRY